MTTIYDFSQRSEALSRIIFKQIDAAGCLSFSSFMEHALYHPEFGYYNRDTIELGKSGDFTTAPEISPLFAQCFARQFREIFALTGDDAVLEIGAGSGRFARDLLLSLSGSGALPSRYFIYETSAALRNKQQHLFQAGCPQLAQRVVWLTALPVNFRGVIFVNEVLDALPVDCFRIENDGIKERCVAAKNGQFQFIHPTATDDLLESAEKLAGLYSLDSGYQSEINLRLPGFIQKLANSLTRGVIFFADYGYGQREYYHPERRQGTLTCFYQHQKHHDPILRPGLQDITAHVDFTRTAEYAIDNGCTLLGYTSQAAFLLASGLMELAAENEKTLNQVDLFHLHQSIKTLTFPTEMGERIKIMALGKQMELALSGFNLQDRRRDL